MNLQSYAQIYSHFHGSFHFDVRDEKYICINLYVQYDLADAVLKMATLRHIEYASTKSLVRALQIMLNIKSIATVFHDEDTWALFLGNKVLLYPAPKGNIVFTSTPFFVTDLQAFNECLTGTQHKAMQTADLIYKLDGGAIVFLDAEDVVYPGASYFGSPLQQSQSYRICFLTRDPKEALPVQILQDRRICKEIPMKMCSVETRISPFFGENNSRISLQQQQLVDYHATSLILQKNSLTKPAYIIQDILESYYGDRIEAPAIGLLIETPIKVGFSGQEYSFTPAANSWLLPLAINCAVPTKTLFVPAPYDRYFLYDALQQREQEEKPWVHAIYYTGNIPDSMKTVFWDNSILGFVYRDTFFCLPHVMLGNRLQTQFEHTNKIFDRLKFKLQDDPNLVVFQSYNNIKNYSHNNSDTLLHCVKHRNLPFELWCLEEGSKDEEGKEGNDNNSSNDKKFLTTKQPELTPLLKNWLAFILENNSQPANIYPDMTYIKIIGVLSRHDVCFSLEEKERGNPTFKYGGGNNKLTFQATTHICKIINQLRLLNKETNKKYNKTHEEKSCRIL